MAACVNQWRGGNRVQPVVPLPLEQVIAVLELIAHEQTVLRKHARAKALNQAAALLRKTLPA